MERLGIFCFLAVLCLTYAQRDVAMNIAERCGICERGKCPEAMDCLAGVVKDSCGCCDVCGKIEFELCDHEDIPSQEKHGSCGENLECRVRADLPTSDRPEAVCYCIVPSELCGSDGRSYRNICHLSATAVKRKEKITVNNKGPCRIAPKIVTPPENAHDREGSNVALICEASGFPIPTIEWSFTRVDGTTEYLPSDDLHISVNMRGGPEKWQITGWLQVMEMGKQHEGDYTCLAQNELGMDKSSARLNVIQDDKKKNKYQDKSYKNDF